MENQTPTQKPKTKSNKNIIIIILILIAIIILAWAGITKAGYIPNYLNIEILCSGNNNDSNYTSSSSSFIINEDGNIKLNQPAALDKPVIYLYPEHEQSTTVNLELQGKIIADYPEYNNQIKGWNVTAYPDGHLINKADNQEYNYLFWEGETSVPIDWNLSTGFVVTGEEIREFLQQTLSKIGLTPKEYNEFIVYWYPKMKDNKYNLIHFVDKQYTDTAPLTITPTPDSLLRVFMVYKPLDEKIEIKPQDIKSFERKGFTVIEWGGTEIK